MILTETVWLDIHGNVVPSTSQAAVRCIHAGTEISDLRAEQLGLLQPATEKHLTTPMETKHVTAKATKHAARGGR